MENIQIVLPGIPPSLNKFAGRMNQWDYRNAKDEWTRLVQYACIKRRPAAPYQHAEVHIHYCFHDGRRRDPDNFCGKLILDGLTKAGVIADDDFKHISLRISAEFDRTQEPYTQITVTEGK